MVILHGDDLRSLHDTNWVNTILRRAHQDNADNPDKDCPQISDSRARPLMPISRSNQEVTVCAATTYVQRRDADA